MSKPGQARRTRRLAACLGVLALGCGGKAVENEAHGSENDESRESGACAPGAPCRSLGFALNPDDGWVAAETNAAEVQGEFFVVSDEDDGGSFAIEPKSFDEAGTSLCVEGRAQAWQPDEFFGWGGGIFFNLNQDEAGATPEVFDALTRGATGVSFSINSLPPDGDVRFMVVRSDEPTRVHCAPITRAQTVLRWEEISEDCWTDQPGVGVDPQFIQAFGWTLVVLEEAYDFDFCLEDLRLLDN